MITTLLILLSSPQLQQVNISAELHKPIVFKFDLSYKPEWKPEDKIQAVNSRWLASTNLSYHIFSDGTIGAWAPVGVHTLSCSQLLINWTKQDIDQREFIATITVTSSDPEPIPPQPDPQPDPTPTPTPVADNPFPNDGKYVLLIEDSLNRYKLPQLQRYVFSSPKVRSVLQNQYKEWRLLDVSTIFSTDSFWKKARDTFVKQKPNDKFGVILSDGVKWEAAALPANEVEMISLLQKYGG